MPFKYWPEIEGCCICIPSLKSASAIITVIAIITNPLLSWLMHRHTYALRVSCHLSTTNRMDIVDVNINNIISFGFGVNADLGTSCLTHYPNGTQEANEAISNKIVEGLGWVILLTDFIFLVTSITFLMHIYRNPSRRIAIAFMVTGIIAVLLSTVYGIFYVIVCAIRGRGIALCQLVLAFFDLALLIYFELVIQAYINKGWPADSQRDGRTGYIQIFSFGWWRGNLARRVQPTASHEGHTSRSRLPNRQNIWDCCEWIINFFRISGLHGIGISVTPSCDIYLTKAADEGTLSLNYLRWCFFIASILYIASTFVFIVGIIVWIKSALEVHIFANIIWGAVALSLAIAEIVMLVNAALSGEPVCYNISDIVCIGIYFICNLYFAAVVSSYVEKKQQN